MRYSNAVALGVIALLLRLLIAAVIAAPILFVLFLLTAGGERGTVRVLLSGPMVIAGGVWLAGRLRRPLARVQAALTTDTVRIDGPISEDAVRQLDLKRPLIIYLRPFDHDSRVVAAPRAPGRYSFDYAELFAPSATAEMLLAARLPQDADLVAVGRPGEWLPPAGFRRVYLSDEHWQPWLLLLLGIADLVVINMGASAGVQWEIEQALNVVEHSRLMFVADQAMTLDSRVAVLAAIKARVPTGPDGPTYVNVEGNSKLRVGHDISSVFWIPPVLLETAPLDVND